MSAPWLYSRAKKKRAEFPHLIRPESRADVVYYKKKEEEKKHIKCFWFAWDSEKNKT